MTGGRGGRSDIWSMEGNGVELQDELKQVNLRKRRSQRTTVQTVSANSLWKVRNYWLNFHTGFHPLTKV